MKDSERVTIYFKDPETHRRNGKTEELTLRELKDRILAFDIPTNPVTGDPEYIHSTPASVIVSITHQLGFSLPLDLNLWENTDFMAEIWGDHYEYYVAKGGHDLYYNQKDPAWEEHLKAQGA